MGYVEPFPCLLGMKMPVCGAKIENWDTKTDSRGPKTNFSVVNGSLLGDVSLSFSSLGRQGAYPSPYYGVTGLSYFSYYSYYIYYYII